MISAMPVAIAPDNSQPQAWRQTAGWGYYGILSSVSESTPSDNDADVTVTARTDRDGATIRPPRITWLTSADSLRNADLHSPDRSPLDSFEAKTMRVGRNPRDGRVHRIVAYSNRAGDALAVRVLVVEYDIATGESMKARVY